MDNGLDLLSKKADSLNDVVRGTDIEVPILTNSFNDLTSYTEELKALDSKIVEFIPEDKEFFDEIMNYYTETKNSVIRNFEITADVVLEKVQKLLVERFQSADIYSIPLLNPKSHYFREAALALDSDRFVDDIYIVEPVIPYNLFVESIADMGENVSSIDISKFDWYVPLMNELIRYYSLSQCEVSQRDFFIQMPNDKYSDLYKEKWEHYHKTLCAIIEEKAELHVYLDAQFDRVLWMYHNNMLNGATPALCYMYNQRARDTYHTYCRHYLTMHRVPYQNITTELEQSIPFVLKGSWQVYIINKMTRAFKNFLNSYDRYTKSKVYWETLQEKIDTYNIKEDAEIDSRFLSNIVVPSIPQFDVMQAFTDSVLSFPQELWRGIDWDEVAINSFTEEAFYRLVDIPQDPSPFIKNQRICTFAWGLLSVLTYRAVQEGQLPSYELFIPMWKNNKLTSYTQMQKLKEYLFSLKGEDVITNTDVTHVGSLLDIIQKTPLPQTRLNDIHFTPVRYDENYDWSNEYDWSELGND